MKLTGKRLMMICLLQAAVAAAALIGLQTVRGDRAEAQVGQAAPARVAVCNISLIFDEYDRAADLGVEFQTRTQQLLTEDQERQAQIETMRAELDSMFAPGSEAYEAQLEQIQTAMVEREVWRRVSEGRMMRERAALMQEMYDEAIAMVRTIAQEQGLDLVLYRDEVDLASESYAELLTKITQRKVLFSAEQLDITATVLSRLDQQYQARQ